MRKQGMFLEQLLWSPWFLRETLTDIFHQQSPEHHVQKFQNVPQISSCLPFLVSETQVASI